MYPLYHHPPFLLLPWVRQAPPPHPFPFAYLQRYPSLAPASAVSSSSPSPAPVPVTATATATPTTATTTTAAATTPTSTPTMAREGVPLPSSSLSASQSAPRMTLSNLVVSEGKDTHKGGLFVSRPLSALLCLTLRSSSFLHRSWKRKWCHTTAASATAQVG